MANFVIGVRNEKGDFVIEADEDKAKNQLTDRRAAIKALRVAAKKHGITKVELFQLLEYKI